eukprot:gene22256-biopygen11727
MQCNTYSLTGWGRSGRPGRGGGEPTPPPLVDPPDTRDIWGPSSRPGGPSPSFPNRGGQLFSDPGVTGQWRGRGAGMARAWRGLWAVFGLGGAGVARAWRGRGAGMSCDPWRSARPAFAAPPTQQRSDTCLCTPCEPHTTHVPELPHAPRIPRIP